MKEKLVLVLFGLGGLISLGKSRAVKVSVEFSELADELKEQKVINSVSELTRDIAKAFRDGDIVINTKRVGSGRKSKREWKPF